MKFKILGTALLSATLLLTACGQSEDHSKKEDDKKSESKSDKKSNDPKKNKDKKKDNNKNKDQSSEDNQQSNTQNNEQQTQQQQVEQQQVNQAPQPPQQQEIYNPARQQALDEGIDFDNPTDAEIERMRELAKDSPHGLQSAPSQGGY